jgi:hypothetical protein
VTSCLGFGPGGGGDVSIEPLDRYSEVRLRLFLAAGARLDIASYFAHVHRAPRHSHAWRALAEAQAEIESTT